MEIKIRKTIKKSIGASIFFFIISLLTLLFISLFIWSNYKVINLSSISWIVIMSIAFLFILGAAISKMKDKQQLFIVSDVDYYEPIYSDEEARAKAMELKNSDDFKQIENSINENGNQ